MSPDHERIDRQSVIVKRSDPLEFYASASTDIGVSRKENQDRLFVEQFLTDYGKIVVAVLCDGMGGLKYGEVASESIVAAFSASRVCNSTK